MQDAPFGVPALIVPVLEQTLSKTLLHYKTTTTITNIKEKLAIDNAGSTSVDTESHFLYQGASQDHCVIIRLISRYTIHTQTSGTQAARLKCLRVLRMSSRQRRHFAHLFYRKSERFAEWMDNGGLWYLVDADTYGGSCLPKDDSNSRPHFFY